MTLEQRKAAERRFVILLLLVETGGHASESELLTALLACEYGFDFNLTEAVVRADLDWLKQRDLVRTDLIMGTMMMAQLTRRGIVVAQERATVEGLLKPIPQE